MMFWDPPREAFRIPFIDHPVAWYGILFAVGIASAYFYLVKDLEPRFGKEEARKVVDRFAFYAVIGVILGARLFHVFFYEEPLPYLRNPFLILKTWEGGLASHGGVLGLVVGAWLFSRKSHFKLGELLESLTIPAAIAAGMIRLGNFVNQEIVGTATNLPWGVVFLHPAGGEPPIQRHPVQLYEALWYWGLGLFFYAFRKRLSGRTAPLFVIGVFAGRFVFEWVKEEQSVWLHSFFSMGQYLSLPAIALGLLWWRVASKRLLKTS